MAGIVAKSSIRTLISSEIIHFLDQKPLPGTDVVTPYVILGDGAFKLTITMMRPYPREQYTTLLKFYVNIL